MASKDTPKTIRLDSQFGVQREGVVSGAVIRPGMLLNIRNQAAIVAHNEAGQECQAAIAIENDLVGKGIDDTYAIGERLRYQVLKDGERFYGIIDENQNIAIGDLLSSSGDGTLKEAAATDWVIGIARSAVVVGAAATGRCIVEVALGRGIA